MKLKKFLKFTVFSYDVCEIRNEFDDFITRRAWRKIIDPSEGYIDRYGNSVPLATSLVA